MHSTASDVIAEQIRRHRTRLGMTREDLAARCAQLGYPEMSYAAITNIERKNKEKAGRRRDVTVDELFILAYALAVPPLLLVFPLGAVDEVSLPPRRNEVGTWFAWKWASGMEPPAVVGSDGRLAVAGGEVGKPAQDIHDLWLAASYPVELYREAEAATIPITAAEHERNFAKHAFGENSEEYARAYVSYFEAFRGLAEALNKMMRAGIKVPAYTPEWAEILKSLGILDRPESLPVIQPNEGQ